jgi:hypothetical protein
MHREPNDPACNPAHPSLQPRAACNPVHRRCVFGTENPTTFPGPNPRYLVITPTRCVVCMENPMDATLVHGDTGHICCCLRCAHGLQSAGFSCPVCREPIAAVIRHFIIES